VVPGRVKTWRSGFVFAMAVTVYAKAPLLPSGKTSFAVPTSHSGVWSRSCANPVAKIVSP